MLCVGCFGSSLVMLRICGVVAPEVVGINCTLTFCVLPFDSLKVPLPVVTVNGGTRAPIVTCRGNLPLFLTLRVLLGVELTVTAPKLRFPETRNVPNGGV